MPVKLGATLPQMKHFDLRKDIRTVAEAAEQTGYDSLWVFERTLVPEAPSQGLYDIPGLPWADFCRSVADPLVTLAMAAAVTERVRLGSSVLVAPYHVPFQLARWFATLDNATGGRAVAGLGSGWSHDEYAAGSVAPFAQRGAVLDELLDVFAAVHGPDPVSYRGTLTDIAPSEVGPKPARPIPVYLTGSTQTALRRVVDRADGWMAVGMHADQLAKAWQGVRGLAAERGRERPLGFAVRANVTLLDKPYHGPDRMPFQGDLDQVVEDLVAHAAIDVLDEVLIELCIGARDGAHLLELHHTVYTAARAAGV